MPALWSTWPDTCRGTHQGLGTCTAVPLASETTGSGGPRAHKLCWARHAHAHLAVVAQFHALVQRRLQNGLARFHLQHDQAAPGLNLHAVRAQAPLRPPPTAAAAGRRAPLSWQRRRRGVRRQRARARRRGAPQPRCCGTERAMAHHSECWLPTTLARAANAYFLRKRAYG